jgi:hypothetical protein
MPLQAAWLDDIVRHTRPQVKINLKNHLGKEELERLVAHPPRRATVSLLHLAHCPDCRKRVRFPAARRK